ncbi:MAG: radical SAM protein [Clostridiaceae bacterium]|nr:radical SAM protein [Clostridiaceae bacterium]
MTAQTVFPDNASGMLPDAAACRLCPRRCGAGRTVSQPGWCGAREDPGDFRIARLMVHHWEEPFISGSRGSGAVFFSGCNLGCCFCQNNSISRQFQGKMIHGADLLQAVLRLHQAGVHNLNLVTPSHYVRDLPAWLAVLFREPDWAARPLPVVWNSSAYETTAALRCLDGLIDIYLPDLKYHESALSAELAGAPDYFAAASAAVLEMFRQQPHPVWDDEGLMLRGMAVRHLVLPGHWQDSCRIIDFLAVNLPPDLPLSLMSQYTPQPHRNRQCLAGCPQGPEELLWPDGHPELDRRLTTYEYRKVTDYALKKGFTHILGQDRSSASSFYTPDFF